LPESSEMKLGYTIVYVPDGTLIEICSPVGA
jgi:hypothetical protein